MFICKEESSLNDRDGSNYILVTFIDTFQSGRQVLTRVFIIITTAQSGQDNVLMIIRLTLKQLGAS